MNSNQTLPRIVAIIPAFNEEKSVANVVRGLLRIGPNVTPLVIDDGSSDRTAEVAREAGAEVISLLQNLGIGGAVQTGYLYARKRGYDIAVQVDADGQHKPDQLMKIVEPLLRGEADLVLGSRFVERTSYVAGSARRLGIRILASFVSAINRQRLYDVTSGFRAIGRKGIELFAVDYATDYPEVDSLVLIKKRGLRIVEVPVEMEPRQEGSSSITPLRSVYYMVKVTLVLFMRSLKKETIR
jgi:glycosyltransferase involved in cell wall biosynthesis